VKVTLHAMRCLKKTESDEDEIYCVVTTGSGTNRRELVRFDVGNFEVGTMLQIALGRHKLARRNHHHYGKRCQRADLRQR
jgi:hypothetical protein